jgi:hypothetical protein
VVCFCSRVEGVDNDLYPMSKFSKVKYTDEDRLKLKNDRYHEGVDKTEVWWFFRNLN